MLPDHGRDWAAVVYMALVAGALALLAQTWAQSHLPPTRTAIVMSMEPVFAAFFAVLLGGEALTARMLLGGAMVLAAMLVVELGPRRHGRGRGPAPHGLTGAVPPFVSGYGRPTTLHHGRLGASVRVRLAETVRRSTRG